MLSLNVVRLTKDKYFPYNWQLTSSDGMAKDVVCGMEVSESSKFFQKALEPFQTLFVIRLDLEQDIKAN